MKEVRYHLRFQIVPGRNVQRDARILAGFCKPHGIEEVVLFFAGEEWNNGLLSAREESMWFDTVKKAKNILDKAGITVSLNPWMTVLHCERGRRFPKDRRFSPAVSPYGEKSRACGSFADKNWQEYIYNLYGRFARLGFRVLWIEDDFRYHNHEPLTWGSGFEPDVLKRFAEKVGRKVTRPEVVRKILKPGEPHPWRGKWMETWREIQLEVAEGLAEAVSKNLNGKSKLGLMSSLPRSHSMEGRDWHRLFDALSIDGEVAHRPHYAHYAESPGKEKTFSIMMLDVQRNFRPANCEVAPEVENSPFTNWTKSDSMTWAEMAFCIFYGSDALLLDLFPFTGNTASQEPQIGNLLDRSRPGLEWISGRFSKNLKTKGVGIPWKENAEEHVRTVHGESMDELDATSFQPGNLLLPYGVPVSAETQKVNAVFGSIAWAFSDDEIYEMLSGGLLIDGLSAEILCRRGFSDLLGIVFKGWVKRDEGKYSLEKVVSKDTGIYEGFYFNANRGDRLGILAPRKGAKEWTSVITPEKRYFGPGIVVHENKLGGRVAAFAIENPACLPFCYQRQTLIQRIVGFLSKGRFGSPFITGGPNILPIHFKGENKALVVVFNGSPDPVKPVIRMDNITGKPKNVTLLPPLEKPVKAKWAVSSEKSSVTVTSQTYVPYLGFLVLETNVSNPKGEKI